MSPRVLVESSRALPLVNLAIGFAAGSCFDPAGKEGLARLSGRLLRAGTTRLAARALEATIDRLGAELTVEVNATGTTLHGHVLRKNLDRFVDLLREVLAEPAFAEAELGRLRDKMLAEILEARDSDRALADQRFRREMFAGHTFARGAQGRPASLAAITRADVVSHHATHRVRGNVTFGFAGDVGEDDARRLADRLNDALPSGPAPSLGGLGDPAGPRGRTLFLVDKPERTQTQILVGARGTWGHDPDHVPLLVAVSIFGGTFTSRLMREIRSKRGWSYGASARLGVERVRHALTMWTFPAARDAAPCLALQLLLLEQLVEGGVSAREVAFSRRFLTRSRAFEVDTPAKRLHERLDVELLALPPDYHTSYLERVAATTAESASRAARAPLGRGSRPRRGRDSERARAGAGRPDPQARRPARRTLRPG